MFNLEQGNDTVYDQLFLRSSIGKITKLLGMNFRTHDISFLPVIRGENDVGDLLFNESSHLGIEIDGNDLHEISSFSGKRYGASATVALVNKNCVYSMDDEERIESLMASYARGPSNRLCVIVSTSQRIFQYRTGVI